MQKNENGDEVVLFAKIILVFLFILAVGGIKMRKKKKKKYVHEDFLSMRKRMLNEISDENIIYEESQTGPQEEPTLQEIHLKLDEWMEKREGKK